MRTAHRLKVQAGQEARINEKLSCWAGSPDLGIPTIMRGRVQCCELLRLHMFRCIKSLFHIQHFPLMMALSGFDTSGRQGAARHNQEQHNKIP